MKQSGIQLITEERNEQVTKHGRTIEEDVKNNSHGQLCIAASILTMSNLALPNIAAPIDWDQEYFSKMCAKLYKERLVIAGALLAAELDRLNAIE